MILHAATADSASQIEDSQSEVSERSVEPSEDVTPERPPTPMYHDPHPPFETDGRGRVVWSNSGEQLRLRSRSSPPPQLRKSNDGTGITGERENCGATGPGIRAGDGGDAGANGDSNGNGDRHETGVKGATAGVS